VGLVTSASPSEARGIVERQRDHLTRKSRFARQGSSLALGHAVLLFATPLYAQTVTTSPIPDTVSVSIYRAPDRGRDEAMQLNWLRGFALVTETRRVSISAGDGVIRFEGVAGGILPESAIVTGLPDGVIEKNQDANLLSPASLLGASTGRRVMIKRTVRATGKVSETEAIIRSGPGGQVVLQTADGIEALRCSGVPETVVYDALPGGLSAKPTLSVRTRSARAVMTTVTLSYLADNFDWQANYVATIGADGKSLDLFGWVTLASADETSFPQAQAMVIAGRVNRDGNRSAERYQTASISLSCWPQGTTSDVYDVPPPPPAPEPMMEMADSIVVTASAAPMLMRAKGAMTVRQEELGDLKLYRVPEPVTVAAKAQKQVALLDKTNVPVKLVWQTRVSGGNAQPVGILMHAKNRVADGLGLPLPAGKVAVYQGGLLIGEGGVDDKAVGEDVEISVARSPSVIATAVQQVEGRVTLTVTNANPYPVAFEATLEGNDLSAFSSKTRRKDGQWLWETVVPANGNMALSYTEKDD
jgi:hypothetical protein